VRERERESHFRDWHFLVTKVACITTMTVGVRTPLLRVRCWYTDGYDTGSYRLMKILLSSCKRALERLRQHLWRSCLCAYRFVTAHCWCQLYLRVILVITVFRHVPAAIDVDPPPMSHRRRRYWSYTVLLLLLAVQLSYYTSVYIIFCNV